LAGFLRGVLALLLLCSLFFEALGRRLEGERVAVIRLSFLSYHHYLRQIFFGRNLYFLAVLVLLTLLRISCGLDSLRRCSQALSHPIAPPALKFLQDAWQSRMMLMGFALLDRSALTVSICEVFLAFSVPLILGLHDVFSLLI